MGKGDDTMRNLNWMGVVLVLVAGMLFLGSCNCRGTKTAGTEAEEKYCFRVDYSMSRAEMIAAAELRGVHGVDEHWISVHPFPIDGVGVVEKCAVLVRPGDVDGDEKARRDLEALGLRPGTMVELLAFGAEYPEVQRRWWVMELGTVLEPHSGGDFVGCLGVDHVGNSSYRSLATCQLERAPAELTDTGRFLAFPK